MSGDDLRHTLEKLVEANNRRQAEAQIELQTKVFGKLIDRSAAYTKGVISVGYAATFGVWAFTRELMSARQQALTGLLLLLSAVVFALWEVYGNITAAAEFDRFLASIRKPAIDAVADLKRYESDIERRQLMRSRSWLFVVCVSLLSAVAAIGIMVWAFVRAILPSLLA